MRRDFGYTLLELLVVLGIVTLLLSVALPFSARSFARAELASDARHVATKLRSLQTMAVATGGIITVSETADGVRATESGSISAEIDGRLQMAGRKQLAFYPDGTSDGGQLLVTRHGETVAIDVAWLSGRIDFGDSQ